MDFSSFWSQYPKKVARPVAEKSWKRLSAAEQDAALEALPNHVRMWNERGDHQYTPYPATWLNQRRWEDEIEVSEPKKPLVAWWTSDAETLKYGASKGIHPRPGEAMPDYKARLRAA